MNGAYKSKKVCFPSRIDPLKFIRQFCVPYFVFSDCSTIFVMSDSATYWNSFFLFAHWGCKRKNFQSTFHFIQLFLECIYSNFCHFTGEQPHNYQEFKYMFVPRLDSKFFSTYINLQYLCVIVRVLL